MFIESVCNRNSPPFIFLCETYRDAGKVRHRTLANLSKWPTDFIVGLRSLFNGRSSESLPASGKSFKIVRSLPHGHVAAVLSTMGRLGFPHILGSKPCPERDLCMAMIAARILFPGSKLATITSNTIVPSIPGAHSWDQNTEPTRLQQKILNLLSTLKAA